MLEGGGPGGLLWDKRQIYYAPSEWTGVWPGVLYNNTGGSGGFEGEYAVTKSSLDR